MMNPVTRNRPRLPGTAFIALMLAATALTPLNAGAAEQPPTVSAAAALGGATSGPGYVVDSEVDSDGYMHVYRLRTNSGTFVVTGDRLMRVRLQEMAALRRLKAMSETDAFRQSFAQAATAPLRFGANLVDDPAATVRGSLSGIANMFDRAGSAISNVGHSRDSLGSSLLGVDVARRQLAYEIGVDPYTDFPPLASALSDMARATAGGKLTVKALTMAVPGAAGMAVSTTSTASSSREMLRDRTSSQVLDHVRNVLANQGVPATLANRLIDNRNYTPTDLLVIATALQGLRARNAAVFVARAAEAVARDEAYFQRVRADMLATHGRALGITEFVSVGGFPLNRGRDGRIVAVFPFDTLAWTDRTERAFMSVSNAMRQGGGDGRGVLAVSGKLTPMAQNEATRLGWTVSQLQ